MKTFYTLFISALFVGICGGLFLSCNSWDLPTKKSQRVCDPPSGTLVAQIQQRKVDFSITESKGTIDRVNWDFGNGSTTVTTGLTVSYTYPTSGTYTAKATLTNTCDMERILQQPVVVSDAIDPTVTLQPVTEFTTTSAILRMAVTSNGNSTITRYGVCYSPTSMTPLADNNNAITQSIPGPIAVNTSIPFSITGLQPNTLYYARSFATNGTGRPGYSAVQQFRTGQNPVVAVNGTANVGITTAAVNFMVSNPGNPAAVEYGIFYSSSTTTPDDKSSTVKVTSPAVNANVVVSLTDLTPNKTYYYRPYAKLPSGEIIYGPVMQFTTQLDPVVQDLIASVLFTDGSLQDVSGLNNHVKLVSSPTFTADRFGRANSAIQLDGVDDYFYMPENSNNSLNPEALSVSIWFKPYSFTHRMQLYNKSRFVDSEHETYSALLKLENDVGPNTTVMTNIKQNSNCVAGKGWLDFPLTSRIPINTWHHLVFTYSGRSVRMYVNNTLLFERNDLPADKMDKCPGAELKFGASIQGLNWFFHGAMDDIRIYKRALTIGEVDALYKQ